MRVSQISLPSNSLRGLTIRVQPNKPHVIPTQNQGTTHTPTITTATCVITVSGEALWRNPLSYQDQPDRVQFLLRIHVAYVR